MNGYQLQNSLPFNSFISNIIELNSEQFLIGQSNASRINVCSSKTMKIIYSFSDINLSSHNYSISKISDEYVAIAGKEKIIMTGCIYIFSIKQLNIYQKIYINDVLSCQVILKLDNNKFITVGKRSNQFDLFSLNIKKIDNDIFINNNFNYKNLSKRSIESLIIIDNYFIITVI